MKNKVSGNVSEILYIVGESARITLAEHPNLHFVVLSAQAAAVIAIAVEARRIGCAVDIEYEEDITPQIGMNILRPPSHFDLISIQLSK
jgi:hypothetical protein